MRFKDKAALITACASGIGRATAGDHGQRRRASSSRVDNDQRRLDMTVEAIEHDRRPRRSATASMR